MGGEGLTDGQDDSLVGGSTWYTDADGDSPWIACTEANGWVSVGGDCDDGDPDVHPGAPEACDGLDDDCDGAVDKGVCDTSGDSAADTATPDTATNDTVQIQGRCEGCSAGLALPGILVTLAGLGAVRRPAGGSRRATFARWRTSWRW